MKITLDENHANSVMVINPTCFYCQHHSDREVSERKCAAFPESIPLEIWNGGNDHTSRYTGDNAIIFEPVQSTKIT